MESAWKSAKGFEWDHGNADKIRARHGVEPFECEEAFFNLPIVAEDAAHSEEETRYYALGRTQTGRSLFLVFTIRAERIRVISARPMSRRERRRYDEKIQETSPV